VRAQAPGKLVISGAYAVLEGAPALVAAVDRYVIADAARPARFEAAEVKAAIAAGAIDRAPDFDASALRQATEGGESRKLGLGSSAAILVASLAAVLGDRIEGEPALREAIFPIALAAHRAAQGGGSGVDVAASTHGGVLAAHLDVASGALRVAPHSLPDGLVIEVFASSDSASTPALLGRVRALAGSQPSRYRALMAAVHAGAGAALAARSAAAFVEAVSAQIDALDALGDAAGAPIVTGDMTVLRPLAAAEGASFGPSGAGGGDIALHMGPGPSSAAFRAAAAERRFELVPMEIGARGVHRMDG
jgi:phosphomevalonate kinase